MNETQIAFYIVNAECTQSIRILKPKWDVDSILAGLRDGTLATTTWFDTSEELSYIDEIATGEPVAVIVAQEIDGEYFDYR